VIGRLVAASLRQRPGRSALLLAGYALGVGVTVTLLSIGGAMVEQSRDRELVGGGDLVVMPEGLDLETFRTGGTSSLYFRIDHAGFVYREVLRGARYREDIRTVAPWIEDELVYLRVDGETVPASASGEIPSAARALGAAPVLVAGEWTDGASDSAWMSPGDSALYASLDGFHLPDAGTDSTWAEWHYFNVSLPEGGLYLTYMIAGEVPDGRWGGRLLATWDDGGEEVVFDRRVDAEAVQFAPGRADLRIGESSVRIRGDGTYALEARIDDPDRPEPLRVRLEIRAARRRYLPPVAIGGQAFASGYVVPLLDARADGSVCVGGRCREIRAAPAYHDHNWGVWRDVTWDWGQLVTDDGLSLLYGGVSRDGIPVGARFAYLFDDEGFLRVLPIESLDIGWSGDGAGEVPASIALLAARGRDTVRVRVEVTGVGGTPAVAEVAGGRGAVFYQMRGEATLRGRVAGDTISSGGRGAFETWRRVSPRPERAPDPAGANEPARWR